MQIVGAEIQHIEELRALLEPLLGVVPALNSRLEIVVDNQRVVITVNDDEITVRDSGRTFQGDWDLAKAALAGYAPPEPEPTG